MGSRALTFEFPLVRDKSLPPLTCLASSSSALVLQWQRLSLLVLPLPPPLLSTPFCSIACCPCYSFHCKIYSSLGSCFLH